MLPVINPSNRLSINFFSGVKPLWHAPFNNSVMELWHLLRWYFLKPAGCAHLGMTNVQDASEFATHVHAQKNPNHNHLPFLFVVMMAKTKKNPKLSETQETYLEPVAYHLETIQQKEWIKKDSQERMNWDVKKLKMPIQGCWIDGREILLCPRGLTNGWSSLMLNAPDSPG